MWTRAVPSLALIGAVAVASGQIVDPEPDIGGNFLWYEQPAESWVEALPVGNGRLGAMVFGGVTEERIQLNIDSLWAGPPFPTVPDGAAEALQEARRLFFAGKPAEGQQVIAERFLAERISPRSQQTLGDLRPHSLCSYLFELAGVFSTFYNADRVIVDESPVRARRLILCARTLCILETGLHLLGLKTLERM